MNHQQVAHHLALYRTNPSTGVRPQQRMARASRRVQPRTTRRGALTVQAPTHQRTQTFRQQSPAISQDHVCSAQNATIRRLQQEKHNYYTQWRQAQAQVDTLNRTINGTASKMAHLERRLDMFERKAHEAALKIAQARTDLWSQQANIIEAVHSIQRRGKSRAEKRALTNIANYASSLSHILRN